jgi:hypothetical protein
MTNIRINIGLFILWFLGNLTPLFHQPSFANPDIPEDNLSYPVLLKWGDGSGSGFFYNKKDATYLITAKHVLFKETVVRLPGQIALPKSLKRKLLVREDKPNNAFDLVLFVGTLLPEERVELMKVVPNQNSEAFKKAMEDLYLQSNDPKLRADKIVLRSSAPKRFGGGVNEMEMDVAKLFNDNHIRYHPMRDVAYVKIGLAKNLAGQEQLTLINGVSKKRGAGIVGIAGTHVKLLKDIKVGNQAIVFGYPTTITEVDPWLDVGLPLLRKGIVAGINKDLQAIILDCPVFGGNSGGLALEIERTPISGLKYSAIGVVTNFVAYQQGWFQNSGYSVVVPMDFVEELFNADNSGNVSGKQ